MKETSEERNAYRKYIESDEAVDGPLEAEEVKLKMPSRSEVEARVTVRLKGDDIELVDKMCDVLGVGRSTFLKMAARMVAQGVAMSSPLELSRLEGIREEDIRDSA